MTLDLVGLAHHLDDALRQRGGIGGMRDGDLDDGELVAAHARDRVRLAHQRPQPLGHHLEQPVAGGMAERVVHGLEVVEIEHVDRHHLAAPDAREGLLEALVEEHAVGKPGQRIVQRHVHDLGLGAPLLGDVLVRGDDAAARHLLRRHGNGAAVAELADVVRPAPSGQALTHPAQQLRRARCRNSSRRRPAGPRSACRGMPGSTWSADRPYISA